MIKLFKVILTKCFRFQLKSFDIHPNNFSTGDRYFYPLNKRCITPIVALKHLFTAGSLNLNTILNINAQTYQLKTRAHPKLHALTKLLIKTKTLALRCIMI